MTRISKILFVLIIILFFTIRTHGQNKKFVVSITDISGSTIDSVSLWDKDLTIEFENGCTLQTLISNIKELKQEKNKKLSIVFSSGRELQGNPKGNIRGQTSLGNYSLQWSKVKKIKLIDTTTFFFEKPSGLSAAIKLKSGENLELAGILSINKYYVPDNNWIPPKQIEKDVIRDKIDFQENASGCYYEIPLEWIRLVSLEKNNYQLSFQLPNSSIVQLNGFVECGDITAASIKLQGCDDLGIWTVPVKNILSIVTHLPIVPYPVINSLCIFKNYGTFKYNDVNTVNGQPYTVYGNHDRNDLGKLTCSVTLKGNIIKKLIHAKASSFLFIKQGESETRIDWNKIKNITSPTTLKYDGWFDSNVVLNSGNILSLPLKIFDYSLFETRLVGVDENGITISIPYDKIKSIEILGNE